MPLAPLPAHTTARYKLRYTTKGVPHAITVHRATADTHAAAITDATALANLLKINLYTDGQFVGIDYAELGSDIFNQIGALAISGTSAGLQPLYTLPYAWSFVGRSTSGRKVRFFLFGVGPSTDTSWRVTTTENTGLATQISGLNSGTGGIAAIDASTTITWKPYVNYTTMRHAVKVVRRGA